MKKSIWILFYSVLALIIVFSVMSLSFESTEAVVGPNNAPMKTFHVSTFKAIEPGRGEFLTAYPAKVIPREKDDRWGEKDKRFNERRDRDWRERDRKR